MGNASASEPQLGFNIAQPGDSQPLSITHPDASKTQLGIAHPKPLQAPTWLWHCPHQVLPTPLALPIQVSSSPSTLLTQMPPSPNLASALLIPDASKPHLSFGITHPGASKPLSTSYPAGAAGWTLTRAQPGCHSPRPEVKRSCRTPCRTEGARVRLTKALTFSLSTKPSHESCWGCSGSEGSMSGWGARTASVGRVPHSGGSPWCPHSTPPAKPMPTPVPTPAPTRQGGWKQVLLAREMKLYISI